MHNINKSPDGTKLTAQCDFSHRENTFMLMQYPGPFY